MRWIVCLAVLAVSTGCISSEVQRYPAEGALGPYSAAVSSGDLVFVSGQVGRDRETFTSEVHSAIDRVERVLAEARLTLGHVVSCTVFLTDIGRYAEFNDAYRERFSEPFPARACVAVDALPGGAQVEVQVIASRKANRREMKLRLGTRLGVAH